jgi:hypothetical protein
MDRLHTTTASNRDNRIDNKQQNRFTKITGRVKAEITVWPALVGGVLC